MKSTHAIKGILLLLLGVSFGVVFLVKANNNNSQEQVQPLVSTKTELSLPSIKDIKIGSRLGDFVLRSKNTNPYINESNISVEYTRLDFTGETTVRGYYTNNYCFRVREGEEIKLPQTVETKNSEGATFCFKNESTLEALFKTNNLVTQGENEIPLVLKIKNYELNYHSKEGGDMAEIVSIEK